jgi:hypothetical protein
VIIMNMRGSHEIISPRSEHALANLIGRLARNRGLYHDRAGNASAGDSVALILKFGPYTTNLSQTTVAVALQRAQIAESRSAL